MTDYYYELYILPDSYYELFCDFILEETSQAIQEISEIRDTHLQLFYFNRDNTEIIDSKTQAPVFEIKGIIVYTQEDPHYLVESLKSFVRKTSSYLSEMTGFVFGILKKKNEDWIQKYKEGITPLECAGYYIRPSWYPPKDQSGLCDIIIDPALAFGSGHHATTSMCIALLSSLELKEKKVLDVGCGSGILSLVAKKKGAIVHLCDTDELAIAESKKNFALNREKIDEIWKGSIREDMKGYDVIVANILPDIIKILYNGFLDISKNGTVLILSGILEKYSQSVIDRFAGFDLIDQIQKDEWIALKLIKR